MSTTAEYSIGEAARILGLTPSALRYYDNENLLPDVGRTSGGSRRFTDDDLEWVRYIERLKMSGMPIKEIQVYVDLYRQGDSTIAQRQKIVEERRAEVERQLAELKTTLDFISYKCWFYEVASESGTCETPRTMSTEDLPPEIRRIREACGIHTY
ncbi:MerR family transcriptional regulator [Arcanobacterium haemolyticum]|nr:MerR family transcriptional regulator [Arcanobacterium haemolyticum]